ncbi:hypothetical protein [Croceicoccus sediminis]|uniref:hypothetical protein n=1 Tax=Croceicoccus sediminis TaxID=2571150 RepID=UPI00118426CE|nr:hypothetical protein [Croceicoccus sediminis]
MAQAEVMKAASLLAPMLDLDEPEQVAVLQSHGFGEGEAWRLINLLPIAFSRPVLEKLGVSNFSDTVEAVGQNGKVVRAKLEHQPEYLGAIKLAREHYARGVMDHNVFKRIVLSASEIDAVSNALNAGYDICGAAVATVLNGKEVAGHLIR